jgi:hypothetical protein
MKTFHWRGVDPEGIGRKGEFRATSPFGFTRRCFDAGWRQLTVDVPGRPGAAAEIWIERGRPTFWSEP